METLFALTIGILVASAVYLMLSGHFLRFIFGLVLISNAANLTIFLAGRLTEKTRVPVALFQAGLASSPG